MMWVCPVCSRTLSEECGVFRCPSGHSFDRSRSGYVNLLPTNRKHGKTPGDNRLMVAARQRFLSAGHYRPLAGCVAQAAAAYAAGGPLLDIGCGEGYYTQAVAEAVGDTVPVLGIDISKIALDKAARRCPKAAFAVASAFHLPVADKTCTVALNLFAPFCGDEIRRVLANRGALIMAIPEEEHLWELKRIIYDRPYKNQVKSFELEGFDLINSEELRYTFTLQDRGLIQDLFMMTPYYYKTGAADQQKLDPVTELTVTAHFRVLIYRLAD